MSVKLYIGTELADFNEAFNVMFSIGDVRNLSFGNCNKAYTLKLPLTKTNKRLISFINQPDVTSETNKTGRLYLGDLLIIQGKVIITRLNDYFAEINISCDDWIDNLKDKRLTDLDLSAYDHAFTLANVENSWSAAYPFYRYPMINFGPLASGDVGTTAKWKPHDFIPMFQITGIMRAILSAYTITSTFLSLGAIKDLYILAREVIASGSFIKDKALTVRTLNASDNEDSVVVADTETGIAQISSELAVFSDKTVNEGSHWGGFDDTYQVPTAGTYRFTVTLTPRNSAYGIAGMVINDESYHFRLLKTSGATVTVLAELASGAYGVDELLHGGTYTLDTDYYHFDAGDAFTVEISCMVEATNNTGSPFTLETGLLASSSQIVAVWNNINKYSGLSKNIQAEALLPDMTQTDFLAAIRDIYNLRFWLDQHRHTLYIEPWDSFLSSTVVDLSAFIDYESIPHELIARSYNSITRLKWKDDSNTDGAYKDYLATADSPGQKDITLTSLYTVKGIVTKEHPFSSIVTGYNNVITQGVPTPWIWKEAPPAAYVTPYPLFDRLGGFNTRLVEWKGLTSGFTWYYETSTKTQYPKIQGLDWSDIYSSYWMKFYHYIDKGKLFTIRMKLKPGMITEFMTVVNTASSEGFRPTYKIRIGGADNYFFLQSITTNGEIAEGEFVLKQ